MNFGKKPVAVVGAVAIVLLGSLVLIARFHGRRTPTAESAAGESAAPPVRTVSTQIEQGELAFNRRCSRCHQLGGVGKAGVAPSIRNPDFLDLTTDDFIRGTVRMGREQTAMASRPDLPQESMESIIAYLRAVQEGEIHRVVTVNPDLRATGGEEAGRAKYAAHCASCHGPDGSGYAGGYAASGIGLPGFLNTASDDYILQTTMRGRVGTAMRPLVGHEELGNLNLWDVYDIIIFLRSLSGASLR